MFLRVARLRLQRFRGFESAVFVLDGHTVIAGEPRSGRSDLVEALRRVLDARSTRGRVDPLDIHRPLPEEVPAPLTEVEVTLLDLGPELEVLLNDYLEPFSPLTGEIASTANAADAVLGLRLCYRARYDFDSDTGDHWVDSPLRSDPVAGIFRRFPRIDREALPALFIRSAPPLQVRAEGAFRALLTDEDPDGLDEALSSLDAGVRAATQDFSQSSPVSAGITKVLASGAGDLLGLGDAAAVEFVPDDGSLAALLRALQPAIDLDEAGVLPARSHGSTAQNVLSVAEAISAANSSNGELVVVADDFGDGLDAAASEHMAYLLHRASNQAILTTRRSEVVRAFASEELVRLTRSHGSRQQHRLGPADRAGRVVRRLALDQLLSALTSRTVVLLEGPLDVEGYGALASRLARATGQPQHSLPANGVRFVCPPGPDGGISRLTGLAELAAQMGFHVRAVVDGDKPGSADAFIDELLGIVEQLVVLPSRTAVEAALIRGVPVDMLRKAAASLESSGLAPLPEDLPDEKVTDYLIDGRALKKLGLHVAWVHALPTWPPIAQAVVAAICSTMAGRIDIPEVE